MESMNFKRRIIYRTAQGKYVVKTEKGTLVYKPKAKFYKNTVPSPIRPKFERVERITS